MRRALLAVIALQLSPPAARAQSAAERVVLARWDDSIAQIRTPADLDRFAAQKSLVSTGTQDLRIALVQLRRAALTRARSATELALIRLDAVAHAHSGWPWPEFILARTFSALSDAAVEFKQSAGVEEGELYIDAAMSHLAEALRLDPAMAQARRLAIALLVPEGDREFRAPERAMIHALLSTRDREADALLVAGRDQRARMHHDSALAYFDRAGSAGGDPSRLQLERARTLNALGDSVGAAAAYWRGAATMTPIGREMYRHDLAWILAPDSLERFDRVPPDSVEAWLRDFWIRRDAAAANYLGERLQEHLHRWNYAFAHFRVDRPWRLNDQNRVEYGFEGFDPCVGSDSAIYELLNREQPAHPDDSRHREPLLDHRGLIYLHHGAPHRVVYMPHMAEEPAGFALTNPPPAPLLARFDQGKIPSPQLDCIPDPRIPVSASGPNESWLYWFGGRWRVMNFRGSCALGVLAPTTLTSYLPVAGDSASAPAWAARSDLTPEYAAAADDILFRQPRMSPSCRDHVVPMIQLSRVDADVATRSDSDTPFVPRPWNAVVQAFGLGSGADRSGEALVTFAIPLDSLHSTRAADGTRTYDIAARIVGYDHVTGRTFETDTLRRIPAPRDFVGVKGHLSAWFELALDPGDWQIAVRLRQPGDSIGAYSLLSHVKIDATARLMLSDLVTGAANGSAWTAPDGAVFPVAVLGAWPAGAAAELYYEVRGLNRGDEYRTAISVKPVDEKLKDVVNIETTDRATGSVSTVRKSLGLAQLKPGSYRIVVTISHGADTATRTRELIIVKQ